MVFRKCKYIKLTKFISLVLFIILIIAVYNRTLKSTWTVVIPKVHKLEPAVKTLVSCDVASGQQCDNNLKIAKLSVPKEFMELAKGDQTLPGCNATFEARFEDNLKFVLRYPVVNSTVFGTRGVLVSNYSDLVFPIKSDTNPSDGVFTADTAYPEFPVIVTAASSDHFYESQGLLKNIHLVLSGTHNNIKVIYYDIGLQKHQRRILEKYCKCEVRTFDFEKYPRHVSRLTGCPWKPIIIHTVLQEYSFVMWNDASVRYKTSNFTETLANAKRYGIQDHTTDPTRKSTIAASITERTDIASFRFLGEEPCLFESFSETEGGFLIFARSDFTMRAVMIPWVSCALHDGCMVTTNGYNLWDKCNQNGHFQGKCHRFDQSILGIILTRLFNFNRDLVTVSRGKYIEIHGEDRVQYFPNT